MADRKPMWNCLTWLAAAFFLATNAAGPVHAAEPVYQAKPLSKWIEDFESGDNMRRVKAEEAFRALGPEAAPALPNLIRALRNNRGPDLGVFVRIGPAAVTHLAPLLDEERTRQMALAQAALRGMKADAIPAIVDVLRTSPPARQLLLIRILADQGDKALASVPTLKEFLRHREDAHRLQAACALVKIDPSANVDAIPVLEKFFRAGTSSQKNDVVWAYGAVVERGIHHGVWGPHNEPAVQGLVQVLKTEGPERTSALAQVTNFHAAVYRRNYPTTPGVPPPETPAPIERIRQELLEATATCLDSKDPQVVAEAIGKLGGFGELAEPLVPRLREIMRQRPGFATTILQAYKGLGPHAKAAEPDVQKLLNHEDPQIRQSAREAMERMLYKPKDVLLAKDEHVGIAGFTHKDNIYRLKAPEEQVVHQTRLRIRARGDRGHDSQGEIAVSLDGAKWVPIGEWTRGSLASAAEKDNWHEVSLYGVSRGWKSAELLVRFAYKAGREQLNVYEVIWENPTVGR